MENNNDFLKTRINFAFVLRTDLENIAKIKEFLSQLPDVVLIFQKADAGKLLIVRENDRGFSG
jgi:nitrate reductase NapAB chaperone NapD